MTIPITSYQIGTSQIQYPDQKIEPNQDQNLEPNQDQIPDMNIEIPDQIINYDFNTPDINEISQNNILNNQPTVNKYNILDIFWLLNPNYLKNQIDKQSSKVEAEFVTLSYNLDFGNIKINLYNINPDSIQNNVIFLQSMTLLVSGTIYPASAFKILNITEDVKFTCIEQLITNTNENWQKERPIVQLEKSNNYINLNIHNKQTNKTYYYTFKDWQLKAFQSALKLTYTNGLNLRANILQNKG